MITITARLKIREGKEKAFEQAMAEIAPKVRDEKGNHGYVFHRSLANSDEILVYEKYADRDAVDEHRQHMKEIGGALADVVQGKPEVEAWQELDI